MAAARSSHSGSVTLPRRSQAPISWIPSRVFSLKSQVCCYIGARPSSDYVCLAAEGTAILQGSMEGETITDYRINWHRKTWKNTMTFRCHEGPSITLVFRTGSKMKLMLPTTRLYLRSLKSQRKKKALPTAPVIPPCCRSTSE